MNMDLVKTLQTVHSTLAYVALFVLLIAVINAFTGWLGKREYTLHKDLRISLFALIFAHIQLVIGLVVYFVSPNGFSALQSMPIGDMSPVVRQLALEHPTTNILAIAFITLGWSRHKRMTVDAMKFRSLALLYGSGLLLILSRIPWERWFS